MNNNVKVDMSQRLNRSIHIACKQLNGDNTGLFSLLRDDSRCKCFVVMNGSMQKHCATAVCSVNLLYLHMATAAARLKAWGWAHDVHEGFGKRGSRGGRRGGNNTDRSPKIGELLMKLACKTY